MKKIAKKTTIEHLAAIVCQAFIDSGLDAVLVGGAVVSLYSKNEYLSRDLDFITSADRKSIEQTMTGLGFSKAGRHFSHLETELVVEFPAPPLAIGEERIENWVERKTSKGKLHLLGPTECVMDRLAAFYHWRDLQALDQAVLVAGHQRVNARRIKAWSKREGKEVEYEVFAQRLKEKRRAGR